MSGDGDFLWWLLRLELLLDWVVFGFVVGGDKVWVGIWDMFIILRVRRVY